MIRSITKLFTITITLSLITVSLLHAQQAPEFSNDLMMGDDTYAYLIADKLEYRSVGGANPIMWDVKGYIGKDLGKFWFKSHGEAVPFENESHMEFQGLYGRAVSPYLDFLAGIRYDLAYEEHKKSRGFAMIGLQGKAPYFIHFESGIYVSESGAISADLEAEYDLLFTQRLVGQPIVEASVAAQKVPEWGVGAGLNHVAVGFRLRYEFIREFAPYIGINWERKLGETADMARAGGGQVSNLSLMSGVRMWF